MRLLREAIRLVVVALSVSAAGIRVEAQESPAHTWNAGVHYLQYGSPASMVHDGGAGLVAGFDRRLGNRTFARASGALVLSLPKNFVTLGEDGPPVPNWLAMTDVQVLARPVAAWPLYSVLGAGLAFPHGRHTALPVRGFVRWGVELGEPMRRTVAMQIWRVRFAYGIGALRSATGLSFSFRW